MCFLLLEKGPWAFFFILRKPILLLRRGFTSIYLGAQPLQLLFHFFHFLLLGRAFLLQFSLLLTILLSCRYPADHIP